MSRLASESATRRACRSKSSIRGLRVMIPARHSPVVPGSLIEESPATRSAAATFCRSSWLSNGLVRNPNTPRCVAATASGIVPCAVRMITGNAGCSRWIASNS